MGSLFLFFVHKCLFTLNTLKPTICALFTGLFRIRWPIHRLKIYKGVNITFNIVHEYVEYI